MAKDFTDQVERISIRHSHAREPMAKVVHSHVRQTGLGPQLRQTRGMPTRWHIPRVAEETNLAFGPDHADQGRRTADAVFPSTTSTCCRCRGADLPPLYGALTSMQGLVREDSTTNSARRPRPSYGDLRVTVDLYTDLYTGFAPDCRSPKNTGSSAARWRTRRDPNSGPLEASAPKAYGPSA